MAKMLIYRKITTFIYLLASAILLLLAVVILSISLIKSFNSLLSSPLSISSILESIGAIVVSIAVLDVSKYLVEEEVLRDKELRSPAEARKTITKIFVIISIATGMEGLVYVFKAGTENISLLIFPGFLILVSSISIICLGLYQKMSIDVEEQVKPPVDVISKTIE